MREYVWLLEIYTGESHDYLCIAETREGAKKHLELMHSSKYTWIDLPDASICEVYEIDPTNGETIRMQFSIKRVMLS